jgi:gamma-glutamyltranspeptidase/glutathione hydrolase
LLNNELTDFAFRPFDRAGRPLANSVGPGKRPRSSMAPTIVFDEAGKPWAALGSPGGSRIILYVVKALVALIDWKLDAQAAVTLMNFGSRGGPFEIEIDHASAVWHALKVKPYGHRVSADLLTSGTHAIVMRKAGLLEGGADPRREGVARGD